MITERLDEIPVSVQTRIETTSKPPKGGRWLAVGASLYLFYTFVLQQKSRREVF